MGFLSVPGHKEKISWLKNMILAEGMPGSLLLDGPANCGLSSLALNIAAWVNCEKEGEDPCGKCPSCYMAANLAHPEITIISPPKNEIPIGAIQEIRKNIMLQPAYGKRRFIIIDPANTMNEKAQNALLKTLEEPPPHASFILVSNSAFGLLPTILSRCIRLEFGLPNQDEILKWLIHYGIEREKARSLCRIPLENRELLEISPKIWAASDKTDMDDDDKDSLNYLKNDDDENSLNYLKNELESCKSLQALRVFVRNAVFLNAIKDRKLYYHFWVHLAKSGRLAYYGVADLICERCAKFGLAVEKLAGKWCSANNFDEKEASSSKSMATMARYSLFTGQTAFLFRKEARNSLDPQGDKSPIAQVWPGAKGIFIACAMTKARENVLENVRMDLATLNAMLYAERQRNYDA